MGHYILSAILMVTTLTATQAQRADFIPLIYVEGGTFRMGSEEAWAGTPKPVHTVTLSSFWISKYEVTVAQYRAYCKATGVAMPAPPLWGWRDNDPIVNVTWQAAKGFAAWFTKKTGRRYNLPTEAQWEYAAKGGKKTQGQPCAGGSESYTTSWFTGNASGQAHAVGQKKPNELGIYDMSGNVGEWCLDWFDRDYYSQSPTTNPINQNVGNKQDRVHRGGSWASSARYCQVVYRDFDALDAPRKYIGFRLVSQ